MRAEDTTRARRERPRIAIDAAADARDHLIRSLGGAVDIVGPEDADVLVRDAARADDVRAQQRAHTAVPTILLVDDPRGAEALALIRAGASAVLARPPDPDELLAAIAAVGAGLVVLDASIREDATARAAALAPALPAEGLTGRERQVLALLADGDSNRRIAERLAISENTVKAHVAAILAKLGATTRTEAVTVAVRLGVVML